MLRLNKITDYAVVVLTQLARDTEQRVTAPLLAQESNIPQPTVAKLLKALVREGILVSQRGAQGGHYLARDPQDISMLEIVRALEGPVALTACVDGAEGDCGVENLCPVRGNWDLVNRAISESLARVSLADMSVPTMFGVSMDNKSASLGARLGE